MIEICRACGSLWIEEGRCGDCGTALRRAVDEARGTDVPEMSGAPSKPPATVVQVPSFSWLYGPSVRTERMVWRRWFGSVPDTPPTPCTPITEPRRKPVFIGGNFVKANPLKVTPVPNGCDGCAWWAAQRAFADLTACPKHR